MCPSAARARPLHLRRWSRCSLARSTVAMATLHNEDQVRAKDVRPGDTVVVRKAGDVIPEVLGPVLADRPAGRPEWEFPSVCPCPHKQPIKREGDDAAHYCRFPRCPEQLSGLDRALRRPQRTRHRALGRAAGRPVHRPRLHCRCSRHLHLGLRADSRIGGGSANSRLPISRPPLKPPSSSRWLGCWSDSTSATWATPHAKCWPRRLGHLDRIMIASVEELAEVDGGRAGHRRERVRVLPIGAEPGNLSRNCGLRGSTSPRTPGRLRPRPSPRPWRARSSWSPAGWRTTPATAWAQ